MANSDIARQRLHSQHHTRPTFEKPDDVVRWHCAVQAQEYLGALWALGLRMRHATEASIEQAIAERRIVRTWPMRGTLHFVAPEDAGWMLELLTPRVIARSAGRYRQLGLDEAVFSRSRDVIVRALAGGKQLTRKAIAGCWRRLASPPPATALHILGHRAARRHLFRLARREAGHVHAARRLGAKAPGPRARRGVGRAGRALLHEPRSGDRARLCLLVGAHDGRRAGAGLRWPRGASRVVIEDQTYWRSSATAPGHPSAWRSLLPAFDEYTVAYRDRSAVIDPARALAWRQTLAPTIVVDGQLVGNWRRTIRKGVVVITMSYFAEPNEPLPRPPSRRRPRRDFLGASVGMR